MSSRAELEKLYSTQPDPWGYADDPFEQEKYVRTIAALPRERYATALEVGCSVGVFTRLASPCVDRLLGVDLSATAVDLARARCADLQGVSFRQLDIVRDDLAERFDLIVCSEVLYYIPPWRRTATARKIAGWLRPGGDLVLVHTWQATTRTWNDIYGEGGAERLHRIFTHVLGLPVVSEVATDVYGITVVRAAPPVKPAWLRQGERLRLGPLAIVPTARMLVRERLLQRPSVRRALGLIGRDGAEPTSDHRDD